MRRSFCRSRARLLALTAALVLLAALPARAVEVQRVVSDQGIEAWLVEDHANPVISMSFAFKGGAALDPEGKPGVANLVSGLLDEGAGDLDSQAFQAALARDAIKLSFDAARDNFYGDLRTLSEHRARAAELLALALTQPRFDAKPVARIKSQVLAGIRNDATKPQARASKAFRRLLFPDHPYGKPVDGTAESLSAIQTADLADFAETRLVRDRLIVGVAGDITPEALKDLLDTAFADLPQSTGDLPEVPAVTPQGAGGGAGGGAGEVVVLDQDIPQSWITFGHGGIARGDPDYYAANLVNYILGGGGFASRLFNEVREKRGLAYSVGTRLNPRAHGHVLAGGLGTGNARAGEALSVVRAQWRRMAEEGPTQEELADAKTHVTGSFPLRLSSTKGIASILVAIQREDLGIDYIDRRKALIEDVTLEQARRVAAELLDADALTVVAVGQPEGIAATRPPPDPAD